eukprot:2275444-Alexandrium_andersonii.AAC.1
MLPPPPTGPAGADATLTARTGARSQPVGGLPYGEGRGRPPSAGERPRCSGPQLDRVGVVGAGRGGGATSGGARGPAGGSDSDGPGPRSVLHSGQHSA